MRTPIRHTLITAITGALVLVMPCALLRAGPDDAAVDRLSTGEMTLEELLNTRITTASNTSEKLSEAPATVIVITREEMARRGIDILLLPANSGRWEQLQGDSRYLSSIGGFATEIFTVFPREGEPTAYVFNRAAWWKRAPRPCQNSSSKTPLERGLPIWWGR